MVVRLTKTLGTLAIVTLVFVYVQYRSPFITVSPDSIRFMHLWQVSVDQARHANAQRRGAGTSLLGQVVDGGSDSFQDSRWPFIGEGWLL